MNSVQRTKGIRKIIRKVVFRKRDPKFVTAGDRACRIMMQNARSRLQAGPSDLAILTWANRDLTWEIMSGFWEIRAA